MNIYEEVTKKLVGLNENSTILEIFKTGSQLFIDTPTDYDYVAVCDNFSKSYFRVHFMVCEDDIDLIIIDKNAVIDQLNFETFNIIKLSNKLYNYMYQVKEVVYGEDTLNYDILQYKNEYIEYLRSRYVNSAGKLVNKTKISKMFVHYYIILKIYENNCVEITEQMLIDINKLYAGGEQVLPLIEWVEEKLFIA